MGEKIPLAVVVFLRVRNKPRGFQSELGGGGNRRTGIVSSHDFPSLWEAKNSQKKLELRRVIIAISPVSSYRRSPYCKIVHTLIFKTMLRLGCETDVWYSSFSFLFICGAADRSGRGTCCSSCCCWGIWGDCFQISHVQPKWVHPEKTFLKNGCIQRNLFVKMGVSRENFS